MQSWPAPRIPELPGRGPGLSLTDTATGARTEPTDDGVGRLYVCGITPYDSTHLGHAFTYVTFDLIGRVWRDAGVDVRYAQNITDVDDPLLERATETGVDWRDLADDQVDLFRGDMAALRVIPPDHYVGVVESIGLVVDAVERLVEAGAAYRVDADVYADLSADAAFGGVGHLDHTQMDELFAERGGDPERPGKRHPLDPLLWRGRRDGEPHWDGRSLGEGRPGWHIECAAIAASHLGLPVTVQGGGTDLIFPHHEMSTSHLRLLSNGTGGSEPIRAFVHSGLVGYQGHKMSKSRGNLVFVSALTADGVAPGAIRLTLLAHHYREDWEFTEADLAAGATRYQAWRSAAARPAADADPDRDPASVLHALRAALADDLDTAAALAVVDAWARTGSAVDAVVIDAVDALLGVDLR
ncbi:cysteine--1-D-myo-inosityl 2-amino-2-deoxy-alpha-D-glucopyranoside ligase [Occultella glacieicola]|uniref:L-cysteine:1D-myo-inositol 2-amino-2-deoxy-alpha-D-glucopyranoside ligase n=1 Tax=Occultella glacieicola TaxID=2518684 RepID=A0ABY2E323_9MICO|nr:cysteine--1-D-myo-inosityl 2-amino-2-deoxy-alpha-D-glucopyranoside ligase [Occultella glacieicola]TDE90361.1 cysteine--1-D-myo-inosityl 2-amino-2-deoxy-alpha-D-glucopyranoside ligase [Occultella glacieicola]